jgi:hypothetical protein
MPQPGCAAARYHRCAGCTTGALRLCYVRPQVGAEEPFEAIRSLTLKHTHATTGRSRVSCEGGAHLAHRAGGSGKAWLEPWPRLRPAALQGCALQRSDSKGPCVGHLPSKAEDPDPAPPKHSRFRQGVPHANLYPTRSTGARPPGPIAPAAGAPCAVPDHPAPRFSRRAVAGMCATSRQYLGHTQMAYNGGYAAFSRGHLCTPGPGCLWASVPDILPLTHSLCHLSQT